MKQSERRIWRIASWGLVALLAICVVSNLIRENAVSHELTLLLFGALVAIGVGRTILDPTISPVLLAEKAETRFRRKQYVVGFVFSAILAAATILTPLRETALAWLFAPMIVLPYALVIRAWIIRE